MVKSPFVHIIIAGMNATPPLSLHQLEDKFPFSVTLDLIVLPLPWTSYNRRSRKWHADKILSYIDKNVKHTVKGTSYLHTLGVTDVELYFEKPLLLFGLSEIGKNSVISLSNLKPKSTDPSKDEEIYEQRALKLGLHELGHTFSLSHCKTKKCVMSFARTIEHIDDQRDEFCNQCKNRLQNNVKSKS